MRCCFKKCPLQPLTVSDARIEIKAVLPSGWSSADRSATLVAWKRNGEANFHKPCWETVLSTARSRRRTGAVVMRQSEKLMVRQAAKTAETFNSVQEVEDAARKAAGLIKKSAYCIAFTGAGISTSAGLGDFRGKSGKWTEEDQHHASSNISAAFQTEATSSSDDRDAENCPAAKKSKLTDEGNHEESEEEEKQENVDYENLRPTYTHESLQLLLDRGYLKFIISQNCDGLHLLSGVPLERLSELHGDVFVEKCEACGKRYSRNYYVLDDGASQYFEELQDYGKTDIKKPKHAVQCCLCGLCHRTGRRCEEKGCSGHLTDTIINFRDHLEEEILNRAMDEASQSDLILCLGTTLTVTPASDLVDMAKGKQPLVICNRQETEKDEQAKVRVFGDCDQFMRRVLHYLLPETELRKWEDGRSDRLEKYQKLRSVSAVAV